MRYAWSALVLAAFVAAPVSAQSLQERINNLDRSRVDPDAVTDRARQRNTTQQMREVMPAVVLDGVGAREALGWWSAQTGISVVVNWNAMEQEGVDSTTPINLRLTMVPAWRVLALMLQTMSAESDGLIDFVYDIEPGYVHVLTKAQANRMPITAVYDVSDLMMDVPNFTNAPSFDLTEALSNTSSGGGRSGGGGGGESRLFEEDEDDQDEEVLTKAERGEQLAQLVRDTIEPSIWQENGGPASVKYLRGMLVVRAPKYIQRQIGTPVRGMAIPAVGGVVDTEPKPTLTPAPTKP